MYNRHKRYVQRFFKERIKKQAVLPKVEVCVNEEPVNGEIEMESVSAEITYCDQGREAVLLIESTKSSETFTCNRYTYKDSSKITCEAETQTDIFEVDSPVKFSNRKLFKDVECNTATKVFEDKAIGPSIKSEDVETQYFSGIESVKKNQQLLDLTGVTLDHFEFLLSRLQVLETNHRQISKRNRLFIFLIKIKTGLTFAAMGVFFGKHRTTISRIFYTTLRHLARSTADLVFWPDKIDVQNTMPECFRTDYNNTRVIIDCTEFRVESPPKVDDRVFTFSHYKKGFTAKLLVGITPGGFISFKSKVAGGRKSDSQITVESGLIDLLEAGDIVLADKGFPHIQSAIDESGIGVFLVMPPFLEKKSEFSADETKETYAVAKCRIQVERIMQRLRTYLILNKITHNLFSSIDDIIHIICVLVNLQPPIIKEKS